MAISFVAATGETVLDSNGPAVTCPAAAQTDDIMLVAIAVQGTSIIGITPPAGWTLIGSRYGTHDCGALYYKFVTGSDTPGTTTYDFVHASGNTSFGLTCYRGVDLTTPLGTPSQTDANSGLSIACPSVTADSADEWLICAYSASIPTLNRVDPSHWTQPTGMTERIEARENAFGGPFTIAGLADLDLTSAGATGSKTATVTGATATDDIGGLSVILKPVAVAITEKSGTDSVALTEAKTLGVSPTVESAALAESARISSTFAKTDSAALTEASRLDHTKTDTATVSEAGALALTSSRTDSAVLTEGTRLDQAKTDSAAVSEVATLAGSFARTESAVLTEATQTAFSRVDTATLTETAQITVTLAAADALALTDNRSAAATLTATDTATLTDTGVVMTTSEAPTAVDSAILSESAQITATLAAVDSAVLTDNRSMAVSYARTDAFTVSEAAAALVAALTGVDAATLTDTTTSLLVSRSAVDSATLTEAIQMAASLSRTDAATVVELAALVAQLQSIDALVLTDTSSLVIPGVYPDQVLAPPLVAIVDDDGDRVILVTDDGVLVTTVASANRALAITDGQRVANVTSGERVAAVTDGARAVTLSSDGILAVTLLEDGTRTTEVN